MVRASLKIQSLISRGSLKSGEVDWGFVESVCSGVCSSASSSRDLADVRAVSEGLTLVPGWIQYPPIGLVDFFLKTMAYCMH